MALVGASVPRVMRRPLTVRWLVPAVIFLLDILSVNVAFVLAYSLRYHFGLGGFGRGFRPVPYQSWTQFEILLTVLIPTSFILAGVYRQRLGIEWVDAALAVSRAATVGMALVIIVTFLFQHLIDQHSRLVLIFTWILIIVLCAAARLLARLVLVHLFRRGWNVRRVVVAGSTTMGKWIMQNLSGRRDQGYHLIGFLHENGADPESFGRFRNLGPVSSASETLQLYNVDEVVIALSATSHEDIMAIRDHCIRQDVAFKIVPDLFEMSLARVRMDEIAGIPLIDVLKSPLRGANGVVKAAIDFILAGTTLIILSPVFLAVALAIKCESPGPVFIAQPRVGRYGHHFPFFKFRSMHMGAERQHAEIEADIGDGLPMVKHKSDPRRTRVGRVIRRLSLDELPQLLNVLRGEMSLVGPRPALPSEVERYEVWHQRRFEVQPGMTGLWQVSGRSDLNFDEMIMMDIFYIENWSIGQDVKILMRTPGAVLMMRGAY